MIGFNVRQYKAGPLKVFFWRDRILQFCFSGILLIVKMICLIIVINMGYLEDNNNTIQFV